MEKYGQLLEKALQSRMHEDIPSDCEDWAVKNGKDDRAKNTTTTTISSSKSLPSQQAPRECRRLSFSNNFIKYFFSC